MWVDGGVVNDVSALNRLQIHFLVVDITDAVSVLYHHEVRRIDREGCEEMESGQGKYAKQIVALNLILTLNNHRSYSDSHNQKDMHFLSSVLKWFFRITCRV